MIGKALLVICLLAKLSKGRQWHGNLTQEFEIGNGGCFGDVTKLTPTGGQIRGYDCYGDVTKLTPKGKRIGGVKASRSFLDAYVNRADKSCFVNVGKRYCIHPAVIAAVASRESGFGFFLTPDGYGDHGHAYGMMQCDLGACPVCQYGCKCTTYKFDSCNHIQMMTALVLVKYIQAVKTKMPSWKPEMQLQGGVAAYNCGVGNVKSWDNLDVGTTNGDYSNDVIAEAQWLITHYGW